MQGLNGGAVCLETVGRRLVLVAVLVAAVALGSSSALLAQTSFSATSGAQTMDDGVAIAWTLYVPDGTAPADGWPTVIVLHGLGGTKETIAAVAEAFAGAGYAALAYDARGHGASGGNVELASTREVADLRTMLTWVAARPEISDTQIGAWGISYGGGQTWNALAAGVPLAAAAVAETWTDLYPALWPQGLPKSGIVSGFANSVSARSPLVASIAQGAIQGTNLDVIRDLAASRSALTKLGAVRTPVLILHARKDFAFDITQATQAFARLAGPKHLYFGVFGHAPSTFPAADIAYVTELSRLWFERFLKGTQNGIDTKPTVELAPEKWNGKAVAFSGLPPTSSTTFALPGSTRITGDGKAVRTTKPLAKAAETFGVSTLKVTVRAMQSYPRLVAVLSAIGPNGKETLVSQGGLVPHAGSNTIRFGNYAVFVPKGSRLRVTLSSTSTAQNTANLVYLAFPGSGSITLGPAQLKLSSLAKPVSG
jgi:predicted acyl esterase